MSALMLACGPVDRDRPPVILLITIDALRADHLGLYGYERDTSPNLDRWFADGIVFEQSYSTEAATAPSVVSLLSGMYPQQHRVRFLYQLLPDESRLITERLPDAYQTAAFVSSVVLTDEAMGMAGRFDHYDDLVDEKEPYRQVYERSAARMTDVVLEWLQHGRDPARPSFVWIHYIDPHGPYHPPEDWSFTFEHDEPVPIDIEKVPGYQREPGVTDGLAYVDRYDEEIAYMDVHLGRLLESYSTIIGDDRGFVFFTADHGESMMEHSQWFTHGYQVYEEIIRVPLMIRGPGLTPGRRRGPVSGIDVAPTILGLAGVDGLDALPGVDLLDDVKLSERTVFSEATTRKRQWRTAIEGERKWTVRVTQEEDGVTVSSRRLYDLGADPDELVPEPWADEGPAAAELLKRIRQDPDPAGMPENEERGVRLKTPKVASRLEAEALERLKAMGYVEE